MVPTRRKDPQHPSFTTPYVPFLLRMALKEVPAFAGVAAFTDLHIITTCIGITYDGAQLWRAPIISFDPGSNVRPPVGIMVWPDSI